ncbi:MAG: primosomal protein [Kutzneria sp.]|nr:primosomal protein [Kutzneria sp.]
MAQDIIPIELGLPQGDLVTLWAPRWREDGEEWEAFLGHDEDLYAFGDVASLAAFVRGQTEHDLTDHPAWHVLPALSAVELTPGENHQFDLVGVPELVSEDPDTWTIGELADVVSILRSLADVCELDKVTEVLDAADGFALLPQGTFPFTGRDGERRWTELAKVVAERWDEVLDAVDAVVSTPDVDGSAVAAAAKELAAHEELEGAESDSAKDTDAEDQSAERTDFWGQVGIDPIKIITSDREYYTLRCYLDDEPIFLGSDGEIDVFTSTKALTRFLASEGAELAGNDLAEVSTWSEVTVKATAGELDVAVRDDNVYVLNGVADDIGDGPDSVDPVQLELAVELLEDAADWVGDESVKQALASSESLGWMVSFVLRPDPTRLAPSAPFDAEVKIWRGLVEDFEGRLRLH